MEPPPPAASCGNRAPVPYSAARSSHKPPPPPAKKSNGLPLPRHHCGPVLAGVPFLICSDCFQLVQLLSDFVVPKNAILRLRCGSCSGVLSYSYRAPHPPYRNKPQSLSDRQAFIQEISLDHSPLGRAATSPAPPAPPPPRCQAAQDDLRTALDAAARELIQAQSEWGKEKLLGCGACGQVYLGVNRDKGQFCAIKEVHVIAGDQQSKERLKQLNQEIDMLRQLSHPNIVKYYGSDLHLTDGVLSVYIEYVPNGSINKLLSDNGPIKEPMIRNYTAQILSGLSYLHGQNTIHRDIKGANILVGPNGEVKLADFGMAKHISSLTEIHSSNKGTIYWMAPEVILSNYSGKGYNRSADIWSLGCTVIEMATGKPPLHHLEPVAAMFKIASNTYMPEIPDNLSDEGRNFLQLCLQRDPGCRPTAAGLVDHPFTQNLG